MWLLQWTLKAAIFFTLFAFALNNQEDILVHFFFGASWRAPLIVVVLSVFVLGVAVGVMGMLPRWWACLAVCTCSWGARRPWGSPSRSGAWRRDCAGAGPARRGRYGGAALA